MKSIAVLFWAQLAIFHSCRQCSRRFRHVSKVAMFSVVWHTLPKTLVSCIERYLDVARNRLHVIQVQEERDRDENLH
jgi:hypothetical protein